MVASLAPEARLPRQLRLKSLSERTSCIELVRSRLRYRRNERANSVLEAQRRAHEKRDLAPRKWLGCVLAEKTPWKPLPGSVGCERSAIVKRFNKNQGVLDITDKFETLRIKIRATSYKAIGAAKWQWRDIFARYDKSGDGELDLSEFTAALRGQLRVAPSEFSDADIKVLFEYLDEEGSGTLELEDLEAFVEQSLKDARSRTGLGTMSKLQDKFKALEQATPGGINWLRVFRKFDTSGDGELSLAEFRSLIRREFHLVNEDVSDMECRCVFEHLDDDNSGEIGIMEFLAFIDHPDEDPEVAQPKQKITGVKAQLPAALGTAMQLARTQAERSRDDQVTDGRSLGYELAKSWVRTMPRARKAFLSSCGDVEDVVSMQKLLAWLEKKCKDPGVTAKSLLAKRKRSPASSRSKSPSLDEEPPWPEDPSGRNRTPSLAADGTYAWHTQPRRRSDQVDGDIAEEPGDDTMPLSTLTIAVEESVLEANSSHMPPEVIVVLNSGSIDGRYVVMNGTNLTGSPIWRHQRAEVFIYSSLKGRWTVGGAAERSKDFLCDSGLFTSSSEHHDRWPHHIPASGWLQYEGMAGWKACPGLEIRQEGLEDADRSVKFSLGRDSQKSATTPSKRAGKRRSWDNLLASTL